MIWIFMLGFTPLAGGMKPESMTVSPPAATFLMHGLERVDCVSVWLTLRKVNCT